MTMVKQMFFGCRALTARPGFAAATAIIPKESQERDVVRVLESDFPLFSIAPTR